MAALLWGFLSTANLIGLVIIIFILAIIHRQLNNVGVAFNKWVGYIIIIPYFIVDKLAPFKWALVIGLVGGIILGFIGGLIVGSDESDGGAE